MGAKRQSVAITDGACLLRMIVRGVPKAVLGIISQSGEPWRCCGYIASWHARGTASTRVGQCHFGISTLEYFAMNVRFLTEVPSNGITSKEPCRRSKRSAG